MDLNPGKHFKSDCPAYLAYVSIMCHQVRSIVAFEKHFSCPPFFKTRLPVIHLKADENKDKHYSNTLWPFMGFFDFQLRDTSFSKLGVWGLTNVIIEFDLFFVITSHGTYLDCRYREIIASNCPRNFIFGTCKNVKRLTDGKNYIFTYKPDFMNRKRANLATLKFWRQFFISFQWQ